MINYLRNEHFCYSKRYYDNGSKQICGIFDEIGLVYNKENIKYFINEFQFQNRTRKSYFSPKQNQQQIAVSEVISFVLLRTLIKYLF